MGLSAAVGAGAGAASAKHVMGARLDAMTSTAAHRTDEVRIVTSDQAVSVEEGSNLKE